MRTPLLLVLFVALPLTARSQENPVPAPSVEETHQPNQFGVPFKPWGE